MVIGSNILAGASGQGGYEIDQSIRFNDDDSAYLTRTPGSEGNRRTFTFSTWVKFATLKADTILFSSWVSSGASSYQILVIDSDFRMRVADHSTNYLITTQKFRDVASWYNVVWRADTTDSTSGDRYQLFINGSRVTAFDTESQPSLNFQGSVNQTQPHYLGRNGYNLAMVYSDLYQAETHFVDGTALDCNSFGEFDSDTGQWIPKQYAGSYGSQGFYIKGQDSSALGDDSSGNNNDFSANGLSSADSVLDSPSDNFATWNLVGSCNVSGQPLTLSDGNLRCSASGTSNAIEAVGTIAPTTGKYYAEFTLNAAPQLTNQYPAIGIIGIDLNITGGNNLNDASFFGYLPSGNKLSGGSSSSYGDTYGNGDIIGIALDLDNQKIYFSKNGTYQNSGDPAAGSNAAFTTLVAGTEYRFCVSHAGSSATDVTMNAGQSAFNTAAPTGFSPMSTANLPDPTVTNPAEYFDSKLWTGNDTDGRAITGYGFQPDWVWIKSRSGAYSHSLTDAVRGVGKYMQSNTTDAEVAGPGAFGSTLAFTSDGFTLDNGTSDNLYVNAGSETYVGWAWKANGSGSSNTAGSINTTATSANTTTGFSISTFTGNGTSGATFGHGLGVAPKMVIVKERSPGGNNWMVGHDSVGWTKYLALDAAQAAITSSARWNNTAPSSTVVTLGDDGGINANTATYVAYCFAEVEGFSKISSFEGNSNADGTFVYTGFKPAFILTKNMDTADQWGIRDAARNPFNVTDKLLNPNSHTAETTSSTGYIDILSNGFKARSSDSNINSNTIIYYAVAESPFKTATAR